MRFTSKSSKIFAWRVCPHRYQNELYEILTYPVNSFLYQIVFMKKSSLVWMSRLRNKLCKKLAENNWVGWVKRVATA